MIDADTFAVAAWSVPEEKLNLDILAQTESVFALCNGHIGLRGNLDEGEPVGDHGTFLNGFYESHALPYAESAYGYPEEGQTLINVTDGKVIRLLVDDEPFDIRYGELRHHERVLDLREGVLQREVEWVSPAGQAVRVRSTRLVSFSQRSVAAIRYEVEAVGASARIVVQSELVANEPPRDHNGDPRASAALRAPLEGEYHSARELSGELTHRTKTSRLRMAAAMEHLVDCPAETVTDAESEPDLARITISTELEEGEKLCVVKFLAYGWSSQRSLPSVRDQVQAALAAARHTGWDGLREAQRDFLTDVWDRADVHIEGDSALQQALRFALFHVVQSGARVEGRAIPAKGLTGSGYDGHTFWDMESYTLPVLSYVLPEAARDVLSWRHSTMDLASARAKELGLEGVAFPWRTIRGQECSGYWPASTAAFHVNGDIAEGVRRYLAATGDEQFARGRGLELVVATARLWRSLGHHDSDGAFRIDGVTGPDEYTALVDNNVYTNLIAARNFAFAAELCSSHPDHARGLDVDQEEIASWRDAADAIAVPYDDELRVTAQCDGFTRWREWDFERTPHDEYPLLMHFHNYLLYSSQVVKQADLVFALYLFGDRFDPDQKARDFEYYERLTVRDSSLSAAIQAIVAAEVGHRDLAFDYLSETAFIDLRDLAFNTDAGIHLAANAGAWLAVVAGFGGMRDHLDVISFAPRLPSRLTRITFGLVVQGRRLRVELSEDGVVYRLRDGDSLEIMHADERLTLEPGKEVRRSLIDHASASHPGPPAGREAPRRHADA